MSEELAMEQSEEPGLPENQETTDSELQTTEQTTENGPADESFFDPSLLPDDPEIQKAYKSMQGQFTKRMQQFSKEREKIDAYNQFMQNPQESLRRMAQQYGVDLGQQQQNDKEFAPNDWNDVVNHIQEQTKQSIMEQLQPLFSDLHNVKRTSTEQYLDSTYPDWRSYENEMMDLLQEHPSLANNPDLLYRNAVPQDVINQRAYQQALKKIKGQTESSKATGNTPNARKKAAPAKISSFNDAVKAAQQQLAEQGLKPPG